MARQRLQGVLGVYRDGYMKGYLTASFRTADRTYYFYPCPKCFKDVVTGMNNYVVIIVNLDENGKRPTKVEVVGIVER